jgi:hypothetical protein
MKKLFLLLAAGVSISAGAQQNQSILLNARNAKAEGIRYTEGGKIAPASLRSQAVAGKSTDQINGEWFSFNVANTITATQGGFIPNYPDSNLYQPLGNPSPFYWWCHGLGYSFDPTSSVFTSNWGNGNVAPPTFAVTNGNPYTIDSIEIVGAYDRFDNVTDSLIVEIAYSTVQGTSMVTWSAGFFYTDGISPGDSSITLAEPVYIPTTNSIKDSIPTAVRIAIPLTAATVSDTVTGGYHDWYVALPQPLNVPAGAKVITFTHFKPGINYPVGTDIAVANQWLSYTENLQGGTHPFQYENDWNGGLIASTDERYQVGTPAVLNNGRKVLSVTYAYTSPEVVFDPYYAFHIKCTSCPSLGVKDVNGAISSVNAFPNPANGEINIDFTVANSGNVNVSISNTIGQVIDSKTVNTTGQGKAVFSTSALASGVYFYTVEADGRKVTNRFVVSH